MPRLSLLICAASLLCLGCNKNSPAPATVSPTTNESTSTVASEADLASVLAGLTQALRKFSVEQRKVPASMNDLVAAGYLQALPQAPPGKAFRIDPKNLQVIVK